MPPPDPSRQRTPLRRISHGSLSNLARSQNQNPNNNDPTRLNFLIPAFADLADEMASLHTNTENLNKLSQVLETFNESFASYLYAMRMNAFCVEWEQAPTDTSFLQAAKAAEEAEKALAALSLRPPSEPNLTEETAHDVTYMTADDSEPVGPSKLPLKPALKNAAGGSKIPGAPAVKPKMTVKDRKAREQRIDRVINTLPLEFRGSDIELRRVMEGVIGSLMNSEAGKRIVDIVKAPLLPQAKVNKCLIALVNRKVVEKDTLKGAAVYRYLGMSDR
ncbi:hypothetical protein FRB94_002292 [Tulasnella sp. JGI-2019a]|nr:hypothetical protein FRB93_004432 [Tulasnella sp. JGI-2019a]KAG9004551.1 hypothetical protein FRB94_002292 [Tulasnella sp. JGI-2019a]KAG9030627.1 hypothetical protein FRB95_003770 [Tulasnella sp. JGI-2019a]